MNSLNTLWLLLKNESAVLVNVISAQGSVPRGVGTWMVVAQNQMVATIGGGHLEHEAIRIANACAKNNSNAEAVFFRAQFGSMLRWRGGVVF